ncbi:FAD-dependent oxidoreductase [Candidatus Parcubacteria bacterium]|nr:MAG: FAD-dependent oxidoreductase [Candidatus Parcubacteria bacterium]
MRFNKLFSPIKIGGVELGNRIVWTGHGTGFGNVMNDSIIAYNVRRARAGVGMIVVGYTSIHPTCRLLPNELICWDDSVIPGYKKLTRAIHEYDTKIVSQISHVGRQGGSDYSGLHLLAPSPIPDIVYQEVPKQMEPEDIQEIVDSYGNAARRVREGGFDGVEIHSGYGGYLIAQFLSNYSNRRNDEYGGVLENRVRFAVDVINNVRKKVGNDYLVGMQLSGDEFTPRGITIEDAIKIAKIVTDTNKLDYLIIKAGTYFSMNTIVPDFQHPVGMLVPFASAIKAEISNTRIGTVGRINDPAYAEQVLIEGHADFIGVCRPLISDPDWVKKARGGNLDDIRYCIGCNQGCEQYLFKVRGISCTHNPEVGRELEYDEENVPRTAIKKRVMVIGGGPAGMKAAEICAKRGQAVTLYEKERELGGNLRLITKLPFRDEFGGIRRFLDNRLRKLDVNINTGVDVDQNMIAESNPDVIIFATGANSTKIGYRQYGLDGNIDGSNQKNVVTEVEFIRDMHKDDFKSRFRGNVVVVDGGENHWRSIGSVVHLADYSRKITYVTPGPFVGHRLPPLSIPPLLLKLYNYSNVSVMTNHILDRINDNSVVVRHLFSNRENVLEDTDMVIVSLDRKANDSLYFKVKEMYKDQTKRIIRIGDCLAPRDTLKAIHDAYTVTMTL